MNKIFYINLDSREDRKKLCEEQLDKLGWKYERIPAIRKENGALGCVLSHIKVLTKARDNKLPYVIIFEDDFKITDFGLFKTKFKKILDTNVSFDVLKFGANALPPYKYIKDAHIGLNFSFCSHAYMVKKHYYDILINNLTQSSILLEKYGKGHKGINCLDVQYNILTRRDNWILLNPPSCVIQRPGFSEIEQKVIDYGHLCNSLKLAEIPFLESPTLKLASPDSKKYMASKFPTDCTEKQY